MNSMGFLQSKEKPIRSTNGNIHLNIPYHYFGKKEYHKSYCSFIEEDTEGNEVVQLIYIKNNIYLTNDPKTSSKRYNVSPF